MDIRIQNCNNIFDGTLHVEEKKLNIKYGLNGTGKTTIRKAIELFSENKPLTQLKPFRYINDDAKKPQIEGISDQQTVMIFDETYVDSIAFQQNDLVKNSFEIFIKTAEYDECQKNIDNYLNKINTVFQNDEELSLFIDDLNSFLTKFKMKANGKISGSSSAGKGLSTGNKLENIPNESKRFKQYLKSDKKVEYIKWQTEGVSSFYGISKYCPFCAKPNIKKNESWILSLQQNYNPTYIKNLSENLSLLQELSKYFKKTSLSKLNSIQKNVDGFTPEQELFIKEVYEQIDTLYNKLVRIKTLSFQTLQTINNIQEELQNYLIDMTVYSHLSSLHSKQKISKINEQIKSIISGGRKLQGAINKQKSYLSKTIKNYTNEINSFLKYSGYQYSVGFPQKEQRYSLNLYFNTYEVPDVKNVLSYGEKNALALVLFMYEVLSKKPDLIILDDPISSFDGNKKFAIIQKLFLDKIEHSKRKINFRGSTVLLLTHEFSTVVDIIKTMSMYTKDIANASFVFNKAGVLGEKSIINNDIKTFIEIADENIKSSQEIINKLVFIRKRLEVENKKQTEWNILSSLFHRKPEPTYFDARNVEHKIGKTDLEAGIKNIKEKGNLLDFDYQELLSKCNDQEYLIRVYKQSSSNYEKLQIYRIINNDNNENSVIKKFVNETFHVENDFIYQINPLVYEVIPNYVIDECNKDLIAMNLLNE